MFGDDERPSLIEYVGVDDRAHPAHHFLKTYASQIRIDSEHACGLDGADHFGRVQ